MQPEALLWGWVVRRHDWVRRSLWRTPPAFLWDHGPPDNMRVGASLPCLGQTWAGAGRDEREEDEEGAGLAVSGEVRRAERAGPRGPGDRASEGLHHLCSDCHPAGSQLEIVTSALHVPGAANEHPAFAAPAR